MIDATTRPAGRHRRVPAIALLIGASAILGLGLGVGLHVLRAWTAAPRSTLSLPAFHGQAVWSPGSRRAPGFALRDQRGSLVSLGGLHGRAVAITFLDSHCRKACPVEGRELGEIARSLPPSERPTLLIVGVNPAGDTPASARAAAARWRITGDWHWLFAKPSQLASVWRDYGIVVRPQTDDIAHSVALYLVDKRGFERTGYLFPFAPAFVARDLRTLAREHA